MTTRTIVIAFCLALVAGCANVPSPGTRDKFTAFDAIELWEKGEILILDVRSETERLRGVPRRQVLAVQYGPDQWNGTVTDREVERFMETVRRYNPDGRPIAILCQYGVRAEAAHRRLALTGVVTRTIVDGYLGNENGPGWKSIE